MIHNKTDMKIPVGEVVIEGTLTLPLGAKGVVLFAHGAAAADSAQETNTLQKNSTRQKLAHCSSTF